MKLLRAKAPGIKTSALVQTFIFSTNLDHGKESAEWGTYDAITFGGMAIAATLGGFIALNYGFKTLFLLAAFTSLSAAFPYVFYLNYKKQKISN